MLASPVIQTSKSNVPELWYCAVTAHLFEIFARVASLENRLYVPSMFR
jgi:hypothetical protein